MGSVSKFRTPPRPANEASRVQAVRELQILDSGADSSFDRITQLAAKIFGTPIALIGFLDRERYWLKSRIGIKIKQVPRDEALCSHTILEKSVLAVCDLKKDERFANNSLVVDNGLQFYAGAPITSMSGYRVGTLCILDSAPRDSFSEAECEILSSLATMVSEALEAHRSRLLIRNGGSDVQERHALVAMTTMDGIWEWDVMNKQVYFSPRCQGLLGLPRIEVNDSIDHWTRRIHPDDLPMLKLQFFSHLRAKDTTFDAEHRVRHNDGSWRWVKVRGLIVRGPSGRCERVTGSFVDVTSLKALDTLTKIPNRLPFIETLDRLIRERRSFRKEGLTVLMASVDRFANLNEQFGSSAGDQILISVAASLSEAVQKLQLGPKTMVARFEGNKFLILLDGVQEESLARYLVQLLQHAISAKASFDEAQVKLSISVGAVLPTEMDRAGDLIQKAQIALSKAKSEGRGSCTLFTPQMLLENAARSRLESELREAIEKQELRVFYQPQIDLASGKLVGCEALVRWQHPQLGLLAPAAFLPLAEENGFISEIDFWVLGTACEQMARWRSLSPQTAELRVSANLSGHKFTELKVNHVIANILEEAALPAEALCLEITETVLMRNIEEALPILKTLQSTGVGLHIDDFGAGYSSFAQLYDLPFDTLKIDRSFLKNVLEDTRAKVIVDAIVVLAKRLDLCVIAEGVEESAHCELLRQLGCEVAQGYFFSRPIDPVQFEEKFIAPLSCHEPTPRTSGAGATLYTLDRVDGLAASA